MAVAGFLGSASTALACSIAETFTITLDHLAEPDFNDPDSTLSRDYREWRGDESADIEVRGVYVYETIHTVEPEGDFSRGSVSVPVEMWGEWPENRDPRVAAPQDRSGEPPDSCGWGPGGHQLGTRSYTVIASERVIELRIDGQDPDAILTAAFGAPDIAERDRSVEEELIAQIDATRNRATGWLVAAGAVALALAAAVFYFSRRGGHSATGDSSEIGEPGGSTDP